MEIINELVIQLTEKEQILNSLMKTKKIKLIQSIIGFIFILLFAVGIILSININIGLLEVFIPLIMTNIPLEVKTIVNAIKTYKNYQTTLMEYIGIEAEIENRSELLAIEAAKNNVISKTVEPNSIQLSIVDKEILPVMEILQYFTNTPCQRNNNGLLECASEILELLGTYKGTVGIDTTNGRQYQLEN